MWFTESCCRDMGMYLSIGACIRIRPLCLFTALNGAVGVLQDDTCTILTGAPELLLMPTIVHDSSGFRV